MALGYTDTELSDFQKINVKRLQQSDSVQHDSPCGVRASVFF
jgi:hypothetical protein